MSSVYVVGGQQRELRPLLATQNWYEYKRGIVLRVNLDTQHAEPCVEYVSPSEVRAEGDPPILFKCASLVGERLYLCTHSEALVYAVPSLEQVNYISLPAFNDVHHVLPTQNNTLLIVITGLDMVLEVTPAGEIVREWAALEDEQPWQRFSRDVDYRKIASTKPHRSHPNQVFYLKSEIWLTRFEQMDAVSLTEPRRRIDIGVERVHDGIVCGDRIFFTTVKGDIVVVDAERLAVEAVIDLNSFHPKGTLLGWCRGLMVDGDRVWVGFSHIRPTKFRENLGWVAHRFRRSEATHIACYDLKQGRCVTEIQLEDSGIDAIFSILPVPSAH